MRSLPSGTVTFLFTDVEGSTRLLHELGAEGYAAALAEHRRLLRAAFTAHSGVEVDTQGDAFFVAFPTPHRDPDLVLAAAARALGAGGPLAEHVADKRLLLLLDNFEHLLDAAAQMGAVLEQCPQLDLLVTSRAPLRLDGEWEYAVDPLRRAEAVELFEQRARAVRRDFASTDVVGEICSRLDDLPLAIELAAARANVLSAPALLERLERRLPLLTGGTRNAPERQRTLRATIEWSHELLSAVEQQLFRRLAVFAGGATLEAVEAVCEADLEALAALVDQSLVRRTAERYWMLETIRELAAEQLEASQGPEETHRRHAEFFLRLAQSANLTADAEEPERHGFVAPEQDNLRAAIDWAEAEGDIELALELTSRSSSSGLRQALGREHADSKRCSHAATKYHRRSAPGRFERRRARPT